MNTCTLSAKLYNAALRFAAKRDVRHYLTRARVEPVAAGGVLIVATDGIRLVALYDAQGSASGVMSVDAVKLPSIPKKGDALVTFADGRATLATGAAVPAQLYPAGGNDSHYPDWRVIAPRQLPAKRPDESCVFAAEYLGDFIAINEAYGSKFQSIRILEAADGEGPAVISFPRDVAAFALVMPIRANERSGHDAPSIPAWLHPEPARAAQAA